CPPPCMNLDISVTGELRIDWDAYRTWVNGLAPAEAAQVLTRAGALKTCPGSIDMLRCEIANEYRVFDLLERHLQVPDRLQDACLFPVRESAVRRLIELYYQFDAPVVRDLLGKKLNAKTRRDLEDTAERNSLALVSCRRQFDNLRRVFKAVEELKGSLVGNIRALFLLPEHLAKEYAAAVFLTNQRFETSKRKLGFLSFNDFAHCANQMIAHWSYSSKDCASQDMDQDLDANFLRDLKELKAMGEREALEEIRGQLASKLQLAPLSQTAMADFEAGHKQLLRRLTQLALSLTTSKDTRDFFLDTVEQLVEPWSQAGWTCNDVEQFLATYRAAAKETSTLMRATKARQKTWDRMLVPMSACIVKIYASYLNSREA
ncbi:hypothetical protein BOX15_Mlig005069g2, partial [Macrostomum lignano]